MRILSSTSARVVEEAWTGNTIYYIPCSCSRAMDCALTSIDMVLLLFQSVDVAAGGLIPVRLFSVAPDYSPTKHVAYHFGSILLMFKYGLQ